jgi:hypothetical protein
MCSTSKSAEFISAPCCINKPYHQLPHKLCCPSENLPVDLHLRMEHKLFTLHTEPSNLRENKHCYQQSHVLTARQCDCASFRLLIVHTTIGQEVSEQNATESSLEEQQHNKREPTGCDCARLKAVFLFSVICALRSEQQSPYL